jgi:hypothetical protein
MFFELCELLLSLVAVHNTILACNIRKRGKRKKRWLFVFLPL